MISPQFMKGRIENPKYKTLKRTIPEEEIQNDNVKKAKTQGNCRDSGTWVSRGAYHVFLWIEGQNQS